MANWQSAYDPKLYLEKFKIEAVKQVIEKRSSPNIAQKHRHGFQTQYSR